MITVTPIVHKFPPEELKKHEEGGCVPTECLVCMQATIPQHIDDHGTKIEDLAGTGEFEGLGG